MYLRKFEKQVRDDNRGAAPAHIEIHIKTAAERLQEWSRQGIYQANWTSNIENGTEAQWTRHRYRILMKILNVGWDKDNKDKANEW